MGLWQRKGLQIAAWLQFEAWLQIKVGGINGIVVIYNGKANL